MELAGEAPSLLLLAAHDALHGRPRHASRQVDRDGRPGGEPLGETQVSVGEAGISLQPVERHEDADRFVSDE